MVLKSHKKNKMTQATGMGRRGVSSHVFDEGSLRAKRLETNSSQNELKHIQRCALMHTSKRTKHDSERP